MRARTASIAQGGKESLHRRALAPALDQQEIVVLRRHRQKAEAIHIAPPARWRGPSRRGSARSPRPPRCATSADWRSRAGLAPSSSLSTSTRVPEPALRLTISAERVGERGLQRFGRALALEARVAGAEQDALHAPPARHQRQAGLRQMHIILAALPDRSDAPARRRIRRGSPPPRRPGCRPPARARKSRARRARPPPRRARRRGCP